MNARTSFGVLIFCIIGLTLAIGLISLPIVVGLVTCARAETMSEAQERYIKYCIEQRRGPLTNDPLVGRHKQRWDDDDDLHREACTRHFDYAVPVPLPNDQRLRLLEQRIEQLENAQ